jgi:hypothetical protein
MGVRQTGERMIAVPLIFFLATAEPNVEQVMQDIQRSHIEANVPERADFEKLMRRDLGAYFAQVRKKKSVPVDFELLRDGPTQSGVSYPKFYAWVRVAGGKSSEDRGAVRLAAIEKKRFEVTDFVSEEMVRRDPDAIYQLFPGQVCERIKAKVAR